MKWAWVHVGNIYVRIYLGAITENAFRIGVLKRRGLFHVSSERGTLSFCEHYVGSRNKFLCLNHWAAILTRIGAFQESLYQIRENLLPIKSDRCIHEILYSVAKRFAYYIYSNHTWIINENRKSPIVQNQRTWKLMKVNRIRIS